MNSKTEIELNTCDNMEETCVFFKVINNETHWALIQNNYPQGGCGVKFLDDNSVVFDEMDFPYWYQATVELKHNGFIAANYYEQSTLVSKDLNPLASLPPEPPYYDDRKANPVYSSGDLWEFPELITIDIYDSWVRALVYEFFEPDWVMIEKQKNEKYKAFFITSDNYICDEIVFNNELEIERYLSVREFERYETIIQNDNKERFRFNKRLHESILTLGIHFPEQPFKKDSFSFCHWYSSGKDDKHLQKLISSRYPD